MCVQFSLRCFMTLTISSLVAVGQYAGVIFANSLRSVLQVQKVCPLSRIFGYLYANVDRRCDALIHITESYSTVTSGADIANLRAL